MSSPWKRDSKMFEVSQFLNSLEEVQRNLRQLLGPEPSPRIEVVLDDEHFNTVVIALLGELDTLRSYDMSLHHASRSGQFRHGNVLVKTKRMTNASPWNEPDAGGGAREHPAQQWDR